MSFLSLTNRWCRQCLPFLKVLFVVGVFVVAGQAFSVQQAHAATFTVDTIADDMDATAVDGICLTSLAECSLRAAIEQANFSSGADIILFDIDPGCSLTLAQLPVITDPVTIDGNCDGDAVILNGNVSVNANSSCDISTSNITSGFIISTGAESTTIKNFVIRYFKFAGIIVESENSGGSDLITISDNAIHTNLHGIVIGLSDPGESFDGALTALTIDNNQRTDSGIQGISSNCDNGIYILDGYQLTPAGDVIISNNYIQDNGVTNTTGDGIEVDNSFVNDADDIALTITSNESIDGNAGNGIYIHDSFIPLPSGTQNNTLDITNNESISNNGTALTTDEGNGITLTDVLTNKSNTDVTINNNLVDSNGNFGIALRNIKPNDTGALITIANNAVSSNGTNTNPLNTATFPVAKDAGIFLDNVYSASLVRADFLAKISGNIIAENDGDGIFEANSYNVNIENDNQIYLNDSSNGSITREWEYGHGVELWFTGTTAYTEKNAPWVTANRVYSNEGNGIYLRGVAFARIRDNQIGTDDTGVTDPAPAAGNSRNGVYVSCYLVLSINTPGDGSCDYNNVEPPLSTNFIFSKNVDIRDNRIVYNGFVDYTDNSNGIKLELVDSDALLNGTALSYIDYCGVYDDPDLDLTDPDNFPDTDPDTGTILVLANEVYENVENGIQLMNTDNQCVYNNFLGLSETVDDLGNDLHGVLIAKGGARDDDDESNFTFGSDRNIVLANSIKFNGSLDINSLPRGDGVAVYQGQTAGTDFINLQNRFSMNSFESNREQAIDLGIINGGFGDDGITNNDVGDTDSGGNEGFNYPVITLAATNVIKGTSAPSSRVEIYVATASAAGGDPNDTTDDPSCSDADNDDDFNSGADCEYHGEGLSIIAVAFANAGGNWACPGQCQMNATFPIAEGTEISTIQIATKNVSPYSSQDTSEFSINETASDVILVVNTTVDENDNVCANPRDDTADTDIGVSTPLAFNLNGNVWPPQSDDVSGQDCSLRDAITVANSSVYPSTSIKYITFDVPPKQNDTTHSDFNCNSYFTQSPFYCPIVTNYSGAGSGGNPGIIDDPGTPLPPFSRDNIRLDGVFPATNSSFQIPDIFLRAHILSEPGCQVGFSYAYPLTGSTPCNLAVKDTVADYDGLTIGDPNTEVSSKNDQISNLFITNFYDGIEITAYLSTDVCYNEVIDAAEDFDDYNNRIAGNTFGLIPDYIIGEGFSLQPPITRPNHNGLVINSSNANLVETNTFGSAWADGTDEINTGNGIVLSGDADLVCDEENRIRGNLIGMAYVYKQSGTLPGNLYATETDTDTSFLVPPFFFPSSTEVLYERVPIENNGIAISENSDGNVIEPRYTVSGQNKFGQPNNIESTGDPDNDDSGLALPGNSTIYSDYTLVGGIHLANTEHNIIVDNSIGMMSFETFADNTATSTPSGILCEMSPSKPISVGSEFFANRHGIILQDGAVNNQIGQEFPDPDALSAGTEYSGGRTRFDNYLGNTISNNLYNGIYMRGVVSANAPRNNLIAGNDIGTCQDNDERGFDIINDGGVNQQPVNFGNGKDGIRSERTSRIANNVIIHNYATDIASCRDLVEQPDYGVAVPGPVILQPPASADIPTTTISTNDQDFLNQYDNFVCGNAIVYSGAFQQLSLDIYDEQTPAPFKQVLGAVGVHNIGSSPYIFGEGSAVNEGNVIAGNHEYGVRNVPTYEAADDFSDDLLSTPTVAGNVIVYNGLSSKPTVPPHVGGVYSQDTLLSNDREHFGAAIPSTVSVPDNSYAAVGSWPENSNFAERQDWLAAAAVIDPVFVEARPQTGNEEIRFVSNLPGTGGGYILTKSDTFGLVPDPSSYIGYIGAAPYPDFAWGMDTVGNAFANLPDTLPLDEQNDTCVVGFNYNLSDYATASPAQAAYDGYDAACDPNIYFGRQFHDWLIVTDRLLAPDGSTVVNYSDYDVGLYSDSNLNLGALMRWRPTFTIDGMFVPATGSDGGFLNAKDWTYPSDMQAAGFGNSSDVRIGRYQMAQLDEVDVCSIGIDDENSEPGDQDIRDISNIGLDDKYTGSANPHLYDPNSANANTGDGWIEMPGLLGSSENISEAEFGVIVNCTNNDQNGAPYGYDLFIQDTYTQTMTDASVRNSSDVGMYEPVSGSANIVPDITGGLDARNEDLIDWQETGGGRTIGLGFTLMCDSVGTGGIDPQTRGIVGPSYGLTIDDTVDAFNYDAADPTSCVNSAPGGAGDTYERYAPIKLGYDVINQTPVCYDPPEPTPPDDFPYYPAFVGCLDNTWVGYDSVMTIGEDSRTQFKLRAAIDTSVAPAQYEREIVLTVLPNFVSTDDDLTSYYAPMTQPADLSFVAASSSGSELSTPVDIPVILSAAQLVPVYFQYSITGGTADNGIDYSIVAATGVVSIPPGETLSHIPSIDIFDDFDSEGDETIEITISSVNNPPNISVVAPTVHTYTILDDELPSVQFSVDSSSGLEDVASPTIDVVLSAAVLCDVDYTVNLFSSTASGGGVDFTEISGTLNFVPPTVTLSLPSLNIVDDLTPETDESIFIELSNATGGCSLGLTSVHEYVILENEPTMQFEVDSSTSSESVANPTINVVLNVAATCSIDYTVNLISSTATGGGVDFTEITGTLNFVPPTTTLALPSLNVVDDGTPDPDETVVIELSNPSLGCYLGLTATHTLTIVEPLVQFHPSSDTADYEYNPTPSILVYVNTAVTCDVDYSINLISSTATGGGVDFTEITGTLNFVPPTLGILLPSLTIVDEADLELDETIVIELSNATGDCDLGPAWTHTYTILNDDPYQLCLNGFSWTSGSNFSQDCTVPFAGGSHYFEFTTDANCIADGTSITLTGADSTILYTDSCGGGSLLDSTYYLIGPLVDTGASPPDANLSFTDGGGDGGVLSVTWIYTP